MRRSNAVVNLEISKTDKTCPVGERVAGKNLEEGKIPVLSCEGGVHPGRNRSPGRKPRCQRESLPAWLPCRTVYRTSFGHGTLDYKLRKNCPD